MHSGKHSENGTAADVRRLPHGGQADSAELAGGEEPRLEARLQEFHATLARLGVHDGAESSPSSPNPEAVDSDARARVIAHDLHDLHGPDGPPRRLRRIDSLLPDYVRPEGPVDEPAHRNRLLSAAGADARVDAEEIRRRAKLEADDIRRRAQREADVIRGQATKEAEDARVAAAEEVAQLRAALNREVRIIRDEVTEQVGHLTAEIETLRREADQSQTMAVAEADRLRAEGVQAANRLILDARQESRRTISAARSAAETVCASAVADAQRQAQQVRDLLAQQIRAAANATLERLDATPRSVD